VNQAYDHIMPVVGATGVKVVHIAPASPTLRGQYERATIDLVINGLRLATGFGTIADVNLTLVPSASDPSGHTLVGTYLDGTRPGRAQTESADERVLGPAGVHLRGEPDPERRHPAVGRLGHLHSAAQSGARRSQHPAELCLGGDRHDVTLQ
jgi:hypothetical protein